MVEIMAAEAVTRWSETESEAPAGPGTGRGGEGAGETLGDQVLGILLELLEAPGMSEEAKAGLRLRVAEHREHPERALLEHLRELRSGAGPASDSTRSAPAPSAGLWPPIGGGAGG